VGCWGNSREGALGYPGFEWIGYYEPPFTALGVAVQ